MNLLNHILVCSVILCLFHTYETKRRVVRSSQENSEGLPKPRLVILGSTGVGKSTLGNVLLGCSPSDENCTFEVCSDTFFCTKETVHEVGKWKGSGLEFTVVDTSSFSNSVKDDNEKIENMITYLEDKVHTANIFLLSFDGSEDNIDPNLQKMISVFEVMFGKKFWDNAILEFTKWSFDEESASQRNKSGKTESWKIEQYNAGLKDMFGIDINLPAVFIDSFSQHESFKYDDDQQEAFKDQTDKLWNLMEQESAYKFQTIGDILTELYEVRKQNDKLVSYMNDAIEELKKDILSVRVENIHNADKISKLNIIPIGSIAAWSGKAITNADLPTGWQLCDGSLITEGPMKNLRTPALNVEGRFLRGGSGSSDWSYQDQMMPIHQHDFSDPGHEHQDEGHDHLEKINIKKDEEDTFEPFDPFNPFYRPVPSPRVVTDTSSSTSYDDAFTDTGHAKIKSSQTGISIGDPTNTTVPLGDEVRPKNMAVQWIIKIY